LLRLLRSKWFAIGQPAELRVDAQGGLATLGTSGAEEARVVSLRETERCRGMLASRERVNLALNHQEADRIPMDLGGSLGTGMHVSTVYRLRQALGLDKPGTPVKVIEPYQMLGEITPDLMATVGTDIINLSGAKNLFGYQNEGWKPWTFFDGIPMLVPGDFNIEPEPNGDVLMYPEGDRSAPPSGRMPKGGFFFDTIVRQPPLDDRKLKVEDNLQEFGPISTEDLSTSGVKRNNCIETLTRRFLPACLEPPSAISLWFPYPG